MSSRTLSVPASDGAMLRVEEHLPAGRIERAAPVVVLAHGWTLTRASWFPVVEALLAQRSVRVVTFDQRGHGASSMGDADPTVRMVGEDLATVLSALAPTGPLVLGGHSMGGMAVMAYAGQHTDELRARVRGVVLVSTAASIEGRKPIPFEGLVMRVCSLAPGIAPGPLVPVAAQRRLSFGKDPRPEDVKAAVRQIQRTPMPTIGRYFTALSAHNELASLAHLDTVPTHIIVGSQDRLTPPTWSQVLHDEIAGSQLTVLEGLGHMLTYEATDVVVDALVAMVDCGIAGGSELDTAAG
jgi:pimeloyl-ACP methyl ester carboxylesterase